MPKILIVDDDGAQRGIVSDILKSESHTVFQAAGVEEALFKLEEERPDVVLTDLKMPGKGGLALVEALRKKAERPEIVVITAFGSIETAVKAMHLGAYDYLNKPLEREELLLVVERAAEKQALKKETRRMKEEIERRITCGLVAHSPAMRKVLETAEKVAASDATVLLRGESGTGKERIARLIHHWSPRGQNAWQAINCAAFPETLLESELFGYEKGAFTGAQGRKLGIIESASGGTLFLDEVADMSLGTQAKLLRALQEKEIRRLGGTASVGVDVRFLAATNKNLEDAVKQGSFREDLFYRLNVIPLAIPTLRQRKEDIVALAEHFLNRSGSRKKIEPAALELLCNYSWPGNVRELQAVMERIAVLSSYDTIRAEDLHQELRPTERRRSANWELPEEGINFEDWERNLLIQALEKSNGVMAEAAKLLGMTYRTFQYRANKFGLKGR